MEEIKTNFGDNANDVLGATMNVVGHEVSVDNQTTSEPQIFSDNYTKNYSEILNYEDPNQDQYAKINAQILADLNVDTAIINNIQEVNEEMQNVEKPNLIERTYLCLPPYNRAEEWLNDGNVENKPLGTVTAGAINQEGDKKNVNFEIFAEGYTRSNSPTDLVIAEDDQMTENSFENADNGNLDATNNNNVDPNASNIGKVPFKSIPPVILQSVNKLFPIGPLNITKEEDLQTVNENTAIVNYNKKYNVARSLSQISLGKLSTGMVSLKKDVTSAETTGIVPEAKEKDEFYIGRNMSNADLQYGYLPPKIQFSRVSNFNRRIGLNNNGSICYVNCVMQVLLATNNFSTFVVIKMYPYPYWSKMAELFVNLMFTVNTTINPRKFYMRFNSHYFNIFAEHDASEFLIYLLELLKRYEPDWERDRARVNARRFTSPYVQDNAVAGPSYRSSEATPRKRPKIVGFNKSRKFYIDNVFGAVMGTMIKCQQCKIVSTKYEMVYMLHLSFPDVSVDSVIKVQSLLNYYFCTESLTGNNRYMCNKCQVKRDALKSSIVVYTPKYLILTLKNFRYDPHKNVSSKKMCSIECDDVITLHSKRNQHTRNTYNLYAVIVHHGHFLDRGHYTAFTKCNNQWYKYNDERVTTIDRSDIDCPKLDETPYMLFYRRTDINEGKFPKYDNIPWLSRYAQREAYNQQEVNFSYD